MTSMDLLRSPGFTLLNDENYGLWVVRMEADLVTRGLWDQVVWEEEETVAEEKRDEEYKKWWGERKKKAEARAALIQRVEDSQLTHMRDWDPAVIWTNLARVHRTHGFATRLALRRRLMTSVKSESESMVAWIGKVKGLAYKLEDIGVAVSSDEKILALTIGLDKSYDTFIISLDSMPTDQLTLDYVID